MENILGIFLFGNCCMFCLCLCVLCADLDSYRLKERLVESEDFILVPAEAWRKLLSWYGMMDDQPALERKVRCKVKTKLTFVPNASHLHSLALPSILNLWLHHCPASTLWYRSNTTLGSNLSSCQTSPHHPVTPANVLFLTYDILLFKPVMPC